jgi:hypothetical protein
VKTATRKKTRKPKVVPEPSKRLLFIDRSNIRPMNVAWHERNSMPPNPTLFQQMAWHREHQKVCGCRPMPARLWRLVKESKKALAAPPPSPPTRPRPKSSRRPRAR